MTADTRERQPARGPEVTPRVGYVAYFFPPVGGVAVARTLGFVRYLPAAGWEPVVIAPSGSSYHLMDPAGLAGIPPGLEVHRALSPEPGHLRGLAVAALRQVRATRESVDPPTGSPAPPRRAASPDATTGTYRTAQTSLAGRIRREVWFPDDQVGWLPFAVAAVLAAHRRRPLDAILSSSSPITAHVVAGIAATMLGIPWVADFRDPWAHTPLDPLGPFDQWRRSTLEAWIIRRATRTVFATSGLRADYAGRYPSAAKRLVTIANGYDLADLAAVRPQAPAAGTRREIVYAGSLYRPEELDTFLRGVGQLVDERPEATTTLHIEFIGSVTDTCRAVANRHLERPELRQIVTFTPFLPRLEALGRLAAADAALTLLGPGPGMNVFVGAKLFDALGLDRQVLGILPPGDARQVLADLDWGIVADPEPASVAVALRRFLDEPPPGRPADPERRFDRRHLAARLADLLDDARAAG